MKFLLSEISNPVKHYKIFQTIETENGIVYKNVATVSKMRTAFFYMDFLEKN